MDENAELALLRRNLLLDALPEPALRQLRPKFVRREMHVRDQIVMRGESIREAVFPISCVLSTLAQGARGELVEVATIGNEGMAGVSLFLAVDQSATLETFAQVPGEALVLSAENFKRHLAEIPRLHEVLGHYTQALFTQISQSAACNRLHPATERMSRWLLMTHDRVGKDDFELTHEFLAQMLGVRRATVSEVAAGLQREGLIQYARGRIHITDRAALEDRACECYRIIRQEYKRLLGFRE